MQKTYFILTLGCQMNISDSQRIESKLSELGYKSAPEKEADLVIVNACSVRQHAVDRIWGKLKRWAILGEKQILITGCILKADASKFKVRNVATFKITQLNNLENIINSKNQKDILDSLAYFHINPNHVGQEAYIPIMTGCDNFCSYCAVPYTRGREVSRKIDDVIAEVKTAVKSGHNKIMLLGQNVNSYGIKSNNSHSEQSAFRHAESFANAKSRTSREIPHSVRDDKVNNDNFIELLNQIDNIDGDFTFNFMSSNPHDMSDGLIDCYANLKKWPRQIHLAMQSGDDEILKKMNRKYTSKQFLELVSKLKNKIPNIKISTDVIVGFPGETKEQFNNTVKICKKISFNQVFIGQYSPRPGTVSAKMVDDVSKEEKKRRWEILNNLINHL